MNIKKVAHIALSGALVCSMFSSSVWKVGATTETSSSRVDEIDVYKRQIPYIGPRTAEIRIVPMLSK